MPIVNFTVIEADSSLIMIDAGYGPVGSILDEILTKLSPKPLSTVIYTHGHVDHAFGIWKIIEKYPELEVIAQQNINDRFKRYIRLNKSLSGHMSQGLEDLPKDSSFFVWPTKTFSDSLNINIDNIELSLFHFKGETDDQLFVHLPEKHMIFSADYYVGFFPNIGNGKRVQRYIEDWSEALKKMITLKPKILIPSHGDALFGTDTIKYELNMLKTAYDIIIEQTIDRMNAQWRKDQITREIKLPDSLVNHPSLEVRYTTFDDASKMLLKQYSGCYNDIPSDWNPASKKEQALTWIELAGGEQKVIEKIKELKESNAQMACHLMDQVFISNPYNKSNCDLLIDVYKYRILNTTCYTQEILAYLRWMTIARTLKKQL